METEQLAKRLKDDDETALEEVIDRFTPLVSTIIDNIAGQSLQTGDLEEVTSDTFITLWYNRSKIQPDKLKGFICCIAKNKAKDKLRTTARHRTVDIEEADFEDKFVVSEAIEAKIITEALRQALEQLGEPDREIILRHYYYYQSSSEISAVTGMKQETVKSRIKRAREKLKKHLSERGYSK